MNRRELLKVLPALAAFPAAAGKALLEPAPEPDPDPARPIHFDENLGLGPGSFSEFLATHFAEEFIE